MVSQSFLAFAAVGSSPSCSSLALFLCFALDLPWPLSRPRNLLVNPSLVPHPDDCACGHCERGWWAWYSSGLQSLQIQLQHCGSNVWCSHLLWCEGPWCWATLISHSLPGEGAERKGLLLLEKPAFPLWNSEGVPEECTWWKPSSQSWVRWWPTTLL